MRSKKKKLKQGKLKQVSAEEFKEFYDERRSCAISDIPKWNGKECSVSWYYVDGGVACVFSDQDGVVRYWIDAS